VDSARRREAIAGLFAIMAGEELPHPVWARMHRVVFNLVDIPIPAPLTPEASAALVFQRAR
jgi:hypothetical protein